VSDIDTGVVDSLKVLDPDGRLEKRSNIGTAAVPRAALSNRSKAVSLRITSSARASYFVGVHCLEDTLVSRLQLLQRCGPITVAVHHGPAAHHA